MESNKLMKIVLSVFIFILLFLGGCISQGSRTDDWVYTHQQSTDIPDSIFVFIAFPVIAWIAISAFLIRKGTPILDDDGSKRTNPKRFLGILLLTGPFAIALIPLFILFITGSTGLGYVLLLIPLLILGFIIYLFIYAKRNKMKKLGIAAAVFTLLIFFGSVFGFAIYSKMTYTSGSRLSATTGAAPMVPLASMPPSMLAAESDSLGLSVGGAKDISNFRENIENDFLPLPTDITYEGLFYEYFFDTGEQEACQKLFCPSYSKAISKDPISQKEEYYLSVGLNSGIKESDFQRKKLNLVIVLDISGSMSSSFSSYYYDRFGQSIPVDLEDDKDAGKSKMKIANEAVVALLDHLNDDDRFGMVLFDDRAYLGKSLSTVGETDMEGIKGHILELEPMGGTRMSAGMKMGTELFEDYIGADQDEYENRIIFLTDAMPNLGDTSEEGLLGMAKENSENKIYTSFIGIGVDFNTELVEYMTKIRGANYYSVHSAREFKTRMDDEFEYMVTPLVFNLLLELDAEGYEIEKVYGSPEADEATGEIMKVNTLFPSKRVEGETKGGIVILKLRKLSPEGVLKLSVNFENRLGEEDSDEAIIELDAGDADFYDNNGIRKGILLSRYAGLLKNWMIDERESYSENQPIRPKVTLETGIIVPDEPVELELGRWERQSIPLQVSDEYGKLFSEFTDYFEVEMANVGDPTLSQDIDVLKKLTNYNGTK
jgi:Ca-activated chloride channel family protein